MRIIGGQFRSRKLKAAPASGIRPTSDKLRETLFNVLGGAVARSVFMDGYAGVGAVGIEALSRGAAFVHFVDRSRKACSIIRENLAGLGVQQGFRILEMQLPAALDVFRKEGVVFDIAFLDPPYDAKHLYTGALELFASPGLLTGGGVLVIEHSKRMDIGEGAGSLERYRVLTQGDSSLSFYKEQQTRPNDDSNLSRIF